MGSTRNSSINTDSEQKSSSPDSLSPPLSSVTIMDHVQRHSAFYVVALGASAGGLEALEKFFRTLPENTGMAFVVVQHLSPDFKSVMDELLARYTKTKIHKVEGPVLLEPNTIYLNHAQKDIYLENGTLRLRDRDRTEHPNLPIDSFLRSLAEDQGYKSIAVILSGTGSDGSRGIRDIHEAGGIVICQSEESAKFDGMPKNAILTGLVDFILPPEEIISTIMQFTGLTHKLDDHKYPDEHKTPDTNQQDWALLHIFHFLKKSYQIDFTLYKPATILRRIQKRMNIHNVTSFEEYVDILNKNSDEIDELYHDLLIGVTEFFRDQEAFNYLENTLIPQIVNKTNQNEGLRIWVPGCATGEEAYSLAILFHEALEKRRLNTDVKIFATDIHPQSLEVAGLGVFNEARLMHLTLERRLRFFKKNGSLFEVSPRIRRMVVFARHNILKDPPFTRIDLISCRNLLIYFKNEAQDKVISIFNFGLKNDGLLFLGPSESLGRMENHFEVVERRWRIFRKKANFQPINTSTTGMLPFNTSTIAPSAHHRLLQREPVSHDELYILKLQSQILQAALPPSILVDDNRHILHIYGDAGKYLPLPMGRPSLDLIHMTEGELRIAINACLHEAEKKRVAPYTGVNLRIDGKEKVVNLLARRIDDPKSDQKFFLISIEDIPQIPADLKKKVSKSKKPLQADESPQGLSKKGILALEEELSRTRSHLRSTIEQLQTSNEELQSTNEELLASNEELQSTNEELHSVNEELYTVNAEFEKKIEELAALSNDVNNLFQSTEIGTIFLDHDFRLRKFTPKIVDLFNFLPQDIGRPISHLSHNIDYPNLLSDLKLVLNTERPIEREVHNKEGLWFLLRILPYRSESGPTSGVVLTFTDITAIKESKEAALRASRSKSEFLASMSHEIRTPINGVLGMTHLLLDTSLNKDQLQYVENIKSSADLLLTVINDILDFSKVESGKMVFENVNFDLHQLIHETTNLFAFFAQEKGLQLEAQLEPHIPLYLIGDPIRLRQIIYNLLNNAIKFTLNGKVTLKINLERQQGSEVCLRFEIIDTGIGIKKEAMEQLFQPFTQEDASTTRRFGGTGLGLSICKGLVQLMGGEIGVESEHQNGSTFWFLLHFHIGIRPQSRPRVHNGQPLLVNNRPAQILVAEDNTVNQLITVRVLEKHGCIPVAVSTGQGVLNALKETSFDLILMDCHMPEMDGFQATEAIRHQENMHFNTTVKSENTNNNRRIPIIALTAGAMVGEREKCITSGMDDYIPKPVTPDSLIEKVREHLYNINNSNNMNNKNNSISPQTTGPDT